MSRTSRPAIPSRLGLLQEEKRSVAVAYLLWALGVLGLPFGVPLGLCGVHRFYCRKPASGTLWLLTFGLCGIGQLIDLLLIPSMVRQANQPLLLEQALAALERNGEESLERHLLQLARRRGPEGFTLNDALLDPQLPQGSDSALVRGEIERLLHADLLDVGNDGRGRVIYREP
ncbi:MAG: TM2 domain-containing protein [Synechococcaceae cyanobacterium]|nr:TM2 domain-containing protein [Synechococcaceae cyanobacterium]